MSRIEAIIQYTATMAIFRNWLAKGIICEEELADIDTILAEKYDLSSCSIYRQNA